MMNKCLLTLVHHFKIMQIFHTKHFSQTKPTYEETSIGEIKGTTNLTKNDWREKVFVCHDENFFSGFKNARFQQKLICDLSRRTFVASNILEKETDSNLVTP